VTWPKNLASYEPVDIPEEARTTFVYSTTASSAARWQDPDGSLWIGYFLRWEAGRETSILATMHRPDICLPAQGRKLVTDFGTVAFEAAGLKLPAQVYQFDDQNRPLFVLYCVWADGQPEIALPPDDESVGSHRFLSTLRKYLLPFTPAAALNQRLSAIANGRRNRGQQVLELGLWGSRNIDEAKQTFARELTNLVVPTP
jgi:hypothetical protein